MNIALINHIQSFLNTNTAKNINNQYDYYIQFNNQLVFEYELKTVSGSSVYFRANFIYTNMGDLILHKISFRKKDHSSSYYKKHCTPLVKQMLYKHFNKLTDQYNSINQDRFFRGLKLVDSLTLSKTINGSYFDVKTVYDPLEYHKLGLSYTATGYGSKIPMDKKVFFNGKLYRLYCRIYGNSGSVYFIVDKKEVYIL